MKIHELIFEYGEKGFWLYDNPVHQPNNYCSKCGKKLETIEPVSFRIERHEMMTLEFEYHLKCVIDAVNESRDEEGLRRIENTFKKRANTLDMPF